MRRRLFSRLFLSFTLSMPRLLWFLDLMRYLSSFLKPHSTLSGALFVLICCCMCFNRNLMLSSSWPFSHCFGIFVERALLCVYALKNLKVLYHLLLEADICFHTSIFSLRPVRCSRSSERIYALFILEYFALLIWFVVVVELGYFSFSFLSPSHARFLFVCSRDRGVIFNIFFYIIFSPVLLTALPIVCFACRDYRFITLSIAFLLSSTPFLNTFNILTLVVVSLDL